MNAQRLRWLPVVMLPLLGLLVLIAASWPLLFDTTDSQHPDTGVGAFGEASTAPTATPTTTTTPTPTPKRSPSRSQPSPSASTDQRAENAALFEREGFGDFADGWLSVFGWCVASEPSTPYEIDSGQQTRITCSVKVGDPRPYITFIRYQTRAQAKTGMVCQQPAGTPAEIDKSEVDLPGTSGSRAGWYCEFGAVSSPTDEDGDVGVSWTDGQLPVKAELGLTGVTMADEAVPALKRLRSMWSKYA